jgi:hypothetical protein
MNPVVVPPAPTTPTGIGTASKSVRDEHRNKGRVKKDVPEFIVSKYAWMRSIIFATLRPSASGTTNRPSSFMCTTGNAPEVAKCKN